MKEFINSKLDQPINQEQQEILKSLTIKILQLILWEKRIINPEFFTKDGALKQVISIGFGLDYEKIIPILYITSKNNVVTRDFDNIWDIFIQIAPNYLWQLPGVSKSWNMVKVNPIDGNKLFDLIRLNKDMRLIKDAYSEMYSIPLPGQRLNLQKNFIDIIDKVKVLKLQKLLPHIFVSDLNPRSPEWLKMLSNPDLKFGSNTGIKIYNKFPSWEQQFEDNFHLLTGIIAEMDVLRLLDFKSIFPGAELIEVGALIEKGTHRPLFGACPDGLLLLPDKSIVPIEIKKVNISDINGIQREIDLAARQLTSVKDLINQKEKLKIVNYRLMIFYDFYNQNIYYMVI